MQDTTCMNCVRFLQDLARSFCMGGMNTKLVPQGSESAKMYYTAVSKALNWDVIISVIAGLQGNSA